MTRVASTTFARTVERRERGGQHGGRHPLAASRHSVRNRRVERADDDPRHELRQVDELAIDLLGRRELAVADRKLGNRSQMARAERVSRRARGALFTSAHEDRYLEQRVSDAFHRRGDDDGTLRTRGDDPRCVPNCVRVG